MASEKTMDKIKLLLPSGEMRHRIMDFRAAFLIIGEEHIHGSAALNRFEFFDDWLKTVRPENPKSDGQAPMPTENPDLLPSTTFIAVRLSDNAVVGITSIRHYLTEARYHDGHIGYSVHPRERGKGYGTEILRQSLIKANQLGIIETVVTCNKNNVASKRVIERNGLKFQKRFTEDNGNTVLIYTTE